ncbi:hypothetical protein [Rhizobium sullae]|uniref:Uncharacterized protein n=1 Tax=Rhizobium sullae TaxID=50338 RepID=A0ABY5XPI4_RHISU|nr:hypothetical protein [Rhizobium sullae]UWU16560.1 hypothetical protein N2599_03065 [Rhizobium sullae]
MSNSCDAKASEGEDPLSHPEIATMSLRQLADLPFNFPAPKPTRYEVRPLSK